MHLKLIVMTLVVALILVGCNISISTPTPIIIVITATPMPSHTPDLVATEVARQRAVAATLTTEARLTQVSVPRPSATPLPPTPTPLPSSRLYNFQASDDPMQGHWRVHVVVEYFYNGEWGADKIFVSATAWNDTPAQIFEIYSESVPITPGYGVVELHHLELHERGTYWTTKIQVCMFAEGTVPRSHCQFWPYPKKWTKQ